MMFAKLMQVCSVTCGFLGVGCYISQILDRYCENGVLRLGDWEVTVHQRYEFHLLLIFLLEFSKWIVPNMLANDYII